MKRETVTLLADGDILAFRSLASNFHEIEWEPDLWTYHVDMASAKAAMSSQLATLKDDTGVDEIVVCLTGAENFRYGLLPTYKGHRKPKPPGYRPFQDWVQETYNSYLRPGLEGDDIIGILATHPDIIPGPKVIWSGDKDLDQIPGLHWKTEKGVKRGKTQSITQVQATRMHLIQTLTGDTTDNYKGCPGWGPGKVLKMLDQFEGDTWANIWARCIAAYEKAGLTYDDFLVQARVARILTHELYDFDAKQPILWEPPTQ